MKRSLLIGLLGLVAVVLLLGALDVIPLGLGSGGDSERSGDAEDLLTTSGEGEDAATLKGIGAKGAKKDDGAVEVAPPRGPAEVHGGTPNGGAVRGRVVRAKGRVPFGGVRVTLSRPDSIIAYLRAEPNGRYDVLEATTDDDGRFAFLDVTPSKGYVVRARHEEFAIASTDDIDLSACASVDIGDLEMGAGASLVGRVVSKDHKPVPNVRVAVTWRISNPLSVILADPATAPELEREGVTDADGRFTIEHLDPRPKTVLVQAPSGAAQVVRSVSLEDGKVKEIDDIVLPGPGVLAGKVVWQDGSPVTDARVFAAPQRQMAVRPTETDASGAFHLTWLPEGENYVLGVLIPGLPVVLREGFSLGTEDVRVEIPMPGRVAGKAVTTGGRPVTRFKLDLAATEQTGDMMMDFVIMQVKRGLGPTPFTDETGAFSFPRVATGSYTITLTAPGFPAVKTDPFVVTAGETTDVRIEVPRGHVARGTVYRADGEPMPEARLFVIEGGVKAEAQGPALSGYVEDRAPDAVSGADGTFELPPQTPGRYDVIATHPEMLAGLARRVDLRNGDANDVRIDLPRSGGVKGLLYDERGLPAKGEEVYVLYRDGVVRMTDTDEDGRFALMGLPTGRCLVRWVSMAAFRVYQKYFLQGATAESREKGYDELRLQGEEHEIVDGNVIELSLKIPPRTKVTGRYLIAGQPPPQNRRRLYVTLEGGGGHWVEVEVGEDGRFETRLESGEYILYGPGARGRYEVQKLVVPGEASYEVDFDL